MGRVARSCVEELVIDCNVADVTWLRLTLITPRCSPLRRILPYSLSLRSAATMQSSQIPVVSSGVLT